MVSTFMNETGYLHVLDGRLRVKVPALKRSPAKADEIETVLSKLDGIFQVKANPQTGNVLVLFDSIKLDHQSVISELKSLSSFELSKPASKNQARAIAQSLVQSAVQIALERMLLALV
jgi:copper chaperone CopZ